MHSSRPATSTPGARILQDALGLPPVRGRGPASHSLGMTDQEIRDRIQGNVDRAARRHPVFWGAARALKETAGEEIFGFMLEEGADALFGVAAGVSVKVGLGVISLFTDSEPLNERENEMLEDHRAREELVDALSRRFTIREHAAGAMPALEDQFTLYESRFQIEIEMPPVQTQPTSPPQVAPLSESEREWERATRVENLFAGGDPGDETSSTC